MPLYDAGGGIGQIPHRKKNDKGFTLVELIVVIVILAILAALLVPALLGWIDKAREEQYGLEARNIYLAAQAQASEAYAAAIDAPNSSAFDVTEIAELADVEKVKISEVEYVKTTTTHTEKDEYKIKTMTVVFKSSSGKVVEGTLTVNQTWTFDDSKAEADLN